MFQVLSYNPQITMSRKKDSRNWNPQHWWLLRRKPSESNQFETRHGAFHIGNMPRTQWFCIPWDMVPQSNFRKLSCFRTHLQNNICQQIYTFYQLKLVSTILFPTLYLTPVHIHQTSTGLSPASSSIPPPRSRCWYLGAEAWGLRDVNLMA